MQEKYLTTAYPNIFFEDNKLGRLKKRLWDASEEEIRRNIVNLALKADEMDNMMVERFGCEFSEYSKADAR